MFSNSFLLDISVKTKRSFHEDASFSISMILTDFLSLLFPSQGMINKSVFEVCKPSMKVINVARGGIIDEKDLLDAMNDGKCGGAALDVFETEPPKGLLNS